MLDNVHGPALKARYRDAQRALLDHAETVAHGRRNGTLTTQQLDALVDAQLALDRLRFAYITGT